MDGKLLLKFNQVLLGKCMCCVLRFTQPQSGGRRDHGFAKQTFWLLMCSVNRSVHSDQLQVTDSNDRVIILQTITAMRADLMTNSNDSNAIIKIPRPNSAGSSRSRHLSSSNMQSSESSRNSTPIGDTTIPGHGRHRHHSSITELRNNWEHRRILSKSLDRLTEVCDNAVILLILVQHS